MKQYRYQLVVIFWLLFQFRASASVLYVDLNSTNPTPPYTNWLTAATNIQDAIDAANPGDQILVTNGAYQTGGRVVNSPGTGGTGTNGYLYSLPITNRVAINKGVTVQSVNGPAVTLIQGYHFNYTQTNSYGWTNFVNDVRGVYMTNNATLDGFTVTGSGCLGSGCGVYCESTNCFLTNCILTGNVCVANDSPYGGAGVYQGTLNDCIISNNIVPVTPWNYYVVGGGAYKSILNNCLIISNSTSDGGGAAYCLLNYCNVIGNIAPFYGSTSWGGGTFVCTANYCLIANNLSTSAGGGDCGGILSYCTLSNNACICPAPGSLGGEGGGSYQQSFDGITIPMLNNCLIISNWAGSGGGVFFNGSVSVVKNCTIVGNTATNQGGGIYYGAPQNCIIYGNNCTSVFSYTSNAYHATLSNCWSGDPIFVNPAGGDFHLQSNSPCINAGNNAYVTTITDLDGNPRIVGGTVDIGAYEYQTPTSIISYAWLQQYDLPTDGSADFIDSDGDGMNNYHEWIAGTNPTNALSVLKMTSATSTNSLPGLVVTWQSVNTRTYYLQSSANLAAQPAFSTIQSNIVGRAGTTSFTDTTATNGGPYFYRVGVQ